MCCLSILWIFLHTGRRQNHRMKISNFTKSSGPKLLQKQWKGVPEHNTPIEKKKEKQLAALTMSSGTCHKSVQIEFSVNDISKMEKKTRQKWKTLGIDLKSSWLPFFLDPTSTANAHPQKSQIYMEKEKVTKKWCYPSIRRCIKKLQAQLIFTMLI